MRYIREGKKHIIPGFGVSITVTVAMLALFVLIPLVSVFSAALKMGPVEFFRVIATEQVAASLLTSIISSLIAAGINAVFGTMIAWVLVRYEFPGKRVLDGLIELPFAMPTAVAGITLSKMYSTSGQPGLLLSKIGIHISYTKLGIIVALIFVGIPFTVRSVMPVLSKLNGTYEEAAYTLGAGSGTVFRRVVLPELLPAILTGFGLSFARGIGEYGSVIYISGNSAREHTQVSSYVIMQKLSYLDYKGATAIALVMLLVAFAVLIMVNAAQLWQSKRTSGTGETLEKETNPSLNDSIFVRCLLIVVSTLFVLVSLVLPLFSVLKNSLSRGFVFFRNSISTEYVISALKVTLIVTVIAVLVNTFFGIMAAWLITRFSFKGNQVLSALIDIPFSISPVIAGLSYIMMFGRLGWAYPVIEWINTTFGTDIQIVFALPGVILATIFVTFPFVSHELIPILNSRGIDEEETAAIMGAGGLKIFGRITLPHIKWALIYGIILCASRALGEFGAVNALSKTRGMTFTLPLEIDALYMSGNADSITAAFCVSSILVVIAIVMLLLRSLFEYKEKRSVR